MPHPCPTPGTIDFHDLRKAIYARLVQHALRLHMVQGDAPRRPHKGRPY